MGIALQWWHHSTVLLYCWHSYSVSIATGMWFCCMNYAVHSVMYGYFAITATKYRKLVSPFAIFITLAQLLQMVVGMYVTVKAVLYQANENECHVNKTNSVLGLDVLQLLRPLLETLCRQLLAEEKGDLGFQV